MRIHVWIHIRRIENNKHADRKGGQTYEQGVALFYGHAYNKITVRMYVSLIEVNLKILKTTLINRTRLRTKGQSAGYPQAQIEILKSLYQRYVFVIEKGGPRHNSVLVPAR